jgi:HSP20 family protein
MPGGVNAMSTNGKPTQLSVRRTIFPELEEMRNEFRDMLRGIWDMRRPLSALRPDWLSAREPAVDVFEREGKVIVKAEMPGIQLSDIDVSISDDELRISGERREEKEIKEENYYRSERTVGHVFRALALPEGCNADAVSATMRDGLLEIVIPRKEQAVSKKVEVRAAT